MSNGQGQHSRPGRPGNRVSSEDPFRAAAQAWVNGEIAIEEFAQGARVINEHSELKLTEEVARAYAPSVLDRLGGFINQANQRVYGTR